MSLLSRIRKTVAAKPSKPLIDTERKRSLSSSRKDSLGTNDHHQYHYRKSTQSSNEKSLKPQNTFRSYSETEDARRKSHRTEPTRKNSSKSETSIKNGKASKTALSRSGTFTMEDDEVELSNKNVSRHTKKEDSHDDSLDEYDRYSRFNTNEGKHF